MGMCCPVKPLKKAAAKGATCTDVAYKNMMDMIAVYTKREYCHLMKIAYDALLKDNRNLEIPCPVLITYGEHDRTGKVRSYCSMWHKQTNYPLVVIKDAGHNANVDNPTEMNQMMEEFIQDVLI